MVCRASQVPIWIQIVPSNLVWLLSYYCATTGMICRKVYHSIFYEHSPQGCIYLIVCVNDNFLISFGQCNIHNLKQDLSC